MGRPTDYTEELADLVCDKLADGESMRTVCKPDDMPDKSTVFRWIRKHEGFRDQYTRAKEESADSLVEEILDISDDATNDWMEINNEEGEIKGYKLNGENINRSRLRVDSRKWIASKLKPKKYGEKIEQKIIASVGLHELTEEELLQRIKENDLAIERSTSD